MTKKVAVINDLSGFGRCSLIAAISTFSAMGVQPCPLPTAILTAQTEYPSYYCDDYTEKMENFRREWEKMGQQFDGIYTGFVANEAQIQQIFHFIDTFEKPGSFLLVDPVMGDDGVKYDTFTPKLLEEMIRLAKRADIITPNLTEICLLTGADHAEILAIQDYDELVCRVRGLAMQFMENGPKHIIVTGIRFVNEENVKMMGNIYFTEESYKVSAFPYVGGSYSGTGDLFASCLAAGIARGDAIPDIIDLAGGFLEEALLDSVEEGVPEQDGVNFEKFLYRLIKK